MKLFFDEDVGRSVPDALDCVGIRTDYVGKKQSYRGVRLGAKDPEWLKRAGKLGLLVFSCNQAILHNPAEREVLIKHKVGAVFLTTGRGRRFEMLRLILNQYEWLKWIDENLPRPFAFRITITGRKTLVIGDEEIASQYKRRH